jgi:hypothetical protein
VDKACAQKYQSPLFAAAQVQHKHRKTISAAQQSCACVSAAPARHSSLSSYILLCTVESSSVVVGDAAAYLQGLHLGFLKWENRDTHTHTHTNPTFLPPTCCYVLSKCVTTQNQLDYSAPATTVPCSTCFHAGKKIIPSPSTNAGSVSAKLTWPPLVWSHVHRSLI